jgi:hypothetical protein
MLDKPHKTAALLAILDAALPFEAELTSGLMAELTAKQSSERLERRQTVSKVTYMGDEGGIMRCMEPWDGKNVIVTSITHVRIPAHLPFAAAVADYQKHRIKKLKKAGGFLEQKAGGHRARAFWRAHFEEFPVYSRASYAKEADHFFDLG